MNLLKVKDKKIPLILILSFLIPLAVMCVVYFINGIAPFGEASILTSDAKIQYKDYFGYLWEVLHSNASLEYSAAKSLGGQTVGLVTYYLTCPLNLLIYFCEKSQISMFLSIMTLIKIAFSGLTASYFIRKRFNISSLACVLLAVCYALSEYNLVYCHNIMWLDGVVILPLACLGVYELLYNNRKALLFFSVFIAVFSNWYSGYMACLMTGFYFLFELALKYDFKNFKNIVKPVLKDAFTTAADMILGVLAGSIVLIPGLLSLLGGKASSELLYTGINVRLFEALKGFAVNAASNQTSATIMYCGAVVLILVVYLFFNKKTDIKKRALSLAAFISMIACFSIDQLNVMWTAFVKSYSYQFRWAFVFMFLMISLAAFSLSEIKRHGFDKITMLKALGLIAVVFVLLDAEKYLNKSVITYLYLAAFAVYGLIIIKGFKNRKRLKQTFALLICVLTVCELTANGADVFSDRYVDKEQIFADYTDSMGDVINDIKKNDSSFYRIEKQVSYLTEVGRENASSESFMYNYNGVASYTSTYDSNVDLFMARMGYSDSTSITEENQSEKKMNATDIYWNSPLFVTDSLLGIKYQMLKAAAPGLEKNENLQAYEEYAVYENPYALPLAFNVSEKLYDGVDYSKNPFENQEKYISAALGREVSFYSEPKVDKGSMSNKKQEIKISVLQDGPLYFYCDPCEYHEKSSGRKCELHMNGERLQRICSRFFTNAVYLGDFKAGDTVELEIKFIDDSKDAKPLTHEDIYLATLNTGQAESALEELASGSSSTLNITENEVSGTYETAADSTVMLTLPYTQGWTLYVDGEEQEYKQIGDTFIGFDLAAGTHQIEMKYSTLHKNAGIAASAAGFAGFAAWCAFDKIKKRKNKSKAV